jgi:hypothetical protein
MKIMASASGLGKSGDPQNTQREALNNRHPPSLRAFKPLAARPKAVAGSNPVLCFSAYFWIAASLRSSQ